MPKGFSGGRGGRGGGHKGQRRHFTSPEALEAEKEKVEREKQWRKARGGDDDSDEDEEKEDKSSDSSEESSSEEDDDSKAKGVQHLIDVENPNRVVKKAKKVENLNPEAEGEKPQLSRREREELEKQQARAHYLKMHAAGKTDEARQDLARLALIKKQREEAAKKRDDDKKLREASKQAKTEATNKALGKKT